MAKKIKSKPLTEDLAAGTASAASALADRFATNSLITAQMFLGRGGGPTTKIVNKLPPAPEEKEEEDNTVSLADLPPGPSDEEHDADYVDDVPTAEIAAKHAAATFALTTYDFDLFPDDFLIINDIILTGVPSAAITVTSDTDIMVNEALRTSAPVICSTGRQSFVLNLSLIFKPGPEQTIKLKRLMGELLHHPLVFIYNNHVRRELGKPLYECSMFAMEQGTLRSVSESPGTIALDLTLPYFNHRPFSNNLWFNAKLPGSTGLIQNARSNIIPDPNTLGNYEASDFALSYQTEKILNDSLPSASAALGPKYNLPVKFPAQSEAWLYLADSLRDRMPYINESYGDFIGFSVREFAYISPPKGAEESSQESIVNLTGEAVSFETTTQKDFKETSAALAGEEEPVQASFGRIIDRREFTQ